MNPTNIFYQMRKDLIAANIDPSKYVPRAGYFQHVLDCKQCTGFTDHYFANGRWWCSGCHQMHPCSRRQEEQ